MLADNYDPKNPFKFAKHDIKDGFWRMQVSSEDAWNFCYVLPHTDPDTTLDNTEIVVLLNCLQMGWCESPPFFCAASETARDVIEALLLELKLPEHPFEGEILNKATASTQFRLSYPQQWRIRPSTPLRRIPRRRMDISAKLGNCNSSPERSKGAQTT